ncbi:serine hydrolase domain-containing protein [Brevibacillus reuszeri]|uniref:serine hydrolase domain-containing protein n=1 Tax=Brevibacillus reuszeri TaxID=54915 RepID=UPI0028A1AF5F|nr:serine hydrolase [Brevibacillus reuszeri]
MSTHTWTQSFEEYTQKLLDNTKTPGAILALAQDGALVYYQSFGYSDVEQKTEITLDTVFGIGSCTKSFACAAIMHLQDAGKLSVHDPVVKYLPEFRTPNAERTKQITIHHFMTHTAGLPPLPALGNSIKRSFEADPHMQETVEQMKEISPIDTYEELMDFIASQKFDLLGEPGTEFSYSNDAYALLGAIIESVSGKPFETYLKEIILDPAGMTNSVFHLEELQGNTDIAMLYSSKGTGEDKEVFPSPAPWDAPPMRAAGFLKSTVKDLLKYLEIFRTRGLVGNTRILSAASVEQLMEPYVEISQSHYYGYGLSVHTDYHGATLVEHGGNIKGVSAEIFLIPEQGITGAILSNLVEAPSPTIMEASLNGYQSRPLQARAIAYQKQELSADHANQYVGTFATLEGNSFTISYEDGTLLLSKLDKASFSLSYIGEDRFVFTQDDKETAIRFIRNSEGHVIRVLGGFRQLTKSDIVKNEGVHT